MKRATFLHGTDDQPTDHWFPWLQTELENAGFSIFAPVLPNNHTPDKKVYDNYLRSADWDFSDNILVGHSSGATTALNLLQSDWLPKIKAALIVGAFLNEKLTKKAVWYEPDQFDNLFPQFFDIEKLKQKCSRFYFVHSKDDPYCDFEDAKKLCKQLNGVFIEVPNGGHLSDNWNVKELPQAIKALKIDNII